MAMAMQRNNRIIEWAMQNRQIVILSVAALFIAGLYCYAIV